jgi:hypothetical protein
MIGIHVATHRPIIRGLVFAESREPGTMLDGHGMVAA